MMLPVLPWKGLCKKWNGKLLTADYLDQLNRGGIAMIRNC